MPEPTTETLAVWLRGVVATVPDVETLRAFHAAVELGAKCSGAEILDVVALGHRTADNAKLQWFAELARTKGAPIPSVGSEALITRLAAASLVRLATSGGEAAVTAGLASRCAAFLGLIPDLPEVTTFADAALAKEGDAVRTRALPYEATASKVPGWVDEALTPASEGTPPSERPNWEAPTVAVAEHLDALAEEIRMRLGLLDEEYNLLWWSHAGRSLTVDEAWTGVAPPARRVVLVGHELGNLTRIPATAMAEGLVSVALGDFAHSPMTLAEVAIAAREADVTIAAAEHTLLPISTAVAQAKIYDEDETWKTVVKKVYGIDVGQEQPGAAIARQIVREKHLGKLL